MGVLARSSVEYFSHCTETFRRGTFMCFRKNLLSKKFRARERGGVARPSVEIDLSHCTGTFRGQTLLCFSKLFFPKKVRDKKGYHDFPSKLFCLTVLKDFVRESLCNSEKIRYEEKSLVKRGSKTVSRFSVELFCLRTPKRFAEEPFCVSENSVLKFFVQKRRISQFQVGNCLSHSTDELLKGTLCASKNFGSRKFLCIRREGM